MKKSYFLISNLHKVILQRTRRAARHHSKNYEYLFETSTLQITFLFYLGVLFYFSII